MRRRLGEPGGSERAVFVGVLRDFGEIASGPGQAVPGPVPGPQVQSARPGAPGCKDEAAPEGIPLARHPCGLHADQRRINGLEVIFESDPFARILCFFRLHALHLTLLQP